MKLNLNELISKYENFNEKRNVVSIKHFEDEARKLSVSITKQTIWYTSLRPLIMKSKNNKKLALDVGCGLGQHTIVLLDFFEQVWGIDFCEYKIKRAQKQFEGVVFKVHDILEPFPIRQVSFVQMITVLQHLNIINKCKLLFNIYSCLENEGIVLMQEGRFTKGKEDSLSSRQTHMFATPISLLEDIFDSVIQVNGTVWMCRK